MSVLRRAKLRTPDGTESIEYPLGVEAENVEVANRENLSQRLARIDEDLEKNEEDIAAVSELAGTNKQNIGANEIRIDALERRSASVDKKPYYFDTVADMKAYQKLKVGDMAITLGYYEKNDGGSAIYKIRTITNDDNVDNASIIEINNTNLIAEQIFNSFINPKTFGCKGDGVTNDTINMQKAIDYAKNNNIKNIKIPNGTYLLSQIKVYRDMNIEGSSRYSILKSINNNTENCLILIEDDNGHNLTIKDLFLEGNKENQSLLQDGIKILSHINWRDVYLLIENVMIRNFTGSGIFSTSKSGKFYAGMRFINVQTYDNTNYGMYIEQGTDGTYESCVSFSNLKGGFRFGSLTSNSMFSNCKAYWNGYALDNDSKHYPGFHISGSRSQFVNCEAQDNYGHGFVFYTGNNYNLISFLADQNGNMGVDQNGNRNTRENIGGEPEYCGVVLNNVGSAILQGNCTNFLYSTIGYSQKSPLMLTNACENIKADILSQAQYTDVLNYSSAKNLSITNNLKIYKLHCPINQINLNENYEIYNGVPFEIYKTGNIVHIKGAIKGKNNTVLPTTEDVRLLTLPSGFRCDSRQVFPAFISNSSLYDLFYTGNCTIYGGGLVQARGNANFTAGNCILINIEYEATN